MENNQLFKSGENSVLYNVAMKGFPLSPQMFILTSSVCFTAKNAHFKRQCIHLFPLMIPVKNPEYIVSWDKSRLSLKSN